MSNKYPQAVFLEVDVHQCQVREKSPLKKLQISLNVDINIIIHLSLYAHNIYSLKDEKMLY